MKECRKCGSTEKYASGRCIPCLRLWVTNNPEKVDQAYKTWQTKNPTKTKASNRKRRGWLPGEHDKAEVALLVVVSCGCCGSKEPRHKFGWLADHDHRTGMFRAHVCGPCNTVIGLVEKYDLDKSPSVSTYLAKFIKHVDNDPGTSKKPKV